MLWAWPGQLSHLPPPAVGIMVLINHKRLGYSLSGLLDLLAKPDIVPGTSSRAIMLPDNTVQSMDLDCVGKLSWSVASYGAVAGNRIPILYFLAGMKKQKSAGSLAGCKTCRHKLGGVSAFVAVAHGLWRMVFHPVGMGRGGMHSK